MKKIFFYMLFLLLIAACHSKKTEEETTTEEQEAITPVTVTTISNEPMTEYIELNATSVFLQKAYVKSSANGYIQNVSGQVGKMIPASQVFFTLKTKEAQAIGNTINVLDSSFKFHGIINIKAGTSGYISEIDHRPGDYVQEGEQLAVISDINSFVFILNLPYELRPYVLNKRTVELLLPDGKKLNGNVSSAMPVVDSASQTQNIVITVNDKNIPTNLIAKVKVIKTERTSALSLPKQAVLSDETQTKFWVMKVTGDSIAIKTEIIKGLETGERIEILRPQFSAGDKFLLTGNYGLPDTAKIKITAQ